VAAACASPRAPDDRPLNPIYDRRDDGRVEKVQVRPFYWREEGPRGRKVNILGPIVRYREDDHFRRLQVFPNVFYTARHSPQELRSWWFTFFPLLFLGSDDFLVVPFGGVSRGILGLDELLVVTPFYARSKRKTSHPTDPAVYTIHHILFPFIAWGSDGRGRRKFRIAPFYGKSHRRDGETTGFILWPFYTWRRKKDERAFFVFPFYGRTVTPTREETTILFPFFNRVEDHLTGTTDTAVFPFWRRATGGDAIDLRRYWPFFEDRRTGFTHTRIVAWPFWRRMYYQDRRQFARYTWVLPFYRQVKSFSRETGREGRKTFVWPLARWERTPDGGREVLVPNLLPFDAPSLREFADPFRPLLSLYHKRISPSGEREVSALFGLVMTRRTKERKKVRLLGGLIGWDRGPEGRHLRLLWAIRLRTGKPR